MSEPIIRSVTPAISIFSVPFKRFGIVPIGGRSTAIKLESGDIFVLVSTPLGPATKTELARLGGPVKYLVAADIEHTMSIAAWHKEFPTAVVVGPEGVKDKIKEVAWTGEYKTNGASSADEKFGFEHEIETSYFKSHGNKDIAFFHKPSKTVLEADILFNLSTMTEQTKGTGIFGLLTSHMGPGTALHKKMVWGIGSADRQAFAQANAVVESWDFDRLIPCHGDVIETGAKQAWISNFVDYAALLKQGKQ